MNKKYFLGLSLLAVFSLCAMHNEQSAVVQLKDREDVRLCTDECLNRLIARATKKRSHKKLTAYEKREKIYETVEYGDFAVTVWDGGQQQ